MESSKERRESPRVPFSTRATVVLHDRRFECEVVNISAGGILLIPPFQARPGTILQLVLSLPGHPQPIELNALVVREAREVCERALGLQFRQMPPETKELLQQFVVRAERPTARVQKVRTRG